MESIAMIRVLHVCHSANQGGAARAALRIHECITEHQKDVMSMMRVISGPSRHDIRSGYAQVRWGRYRARLGVWISNKLVGNKGFRDNYRSIGVIHTGLCRELNAQYRNGSYDLLNLHWIGPQVMSAYELGRLEAPVVWTMHDENPFRGTYHYDRVSKVIEETQEKRIVKRVESCLGDILDRVVMEYKYRCFKKIRWFIAPSKWMMEEFNLSAMKKRGNVLGIPYPMNSDEWGYEEVGKAKESLGLRKDGVAMLFGAEGGLSDTRKGGQLLLDSLGFLWEALCDDERKNIEVITFGRASSQMTSKIRFSVRDVGVIGSDSELNRVYSGADIFMLPSIYDNLPNTGLEALMCGCSVVAFDVAGLSDIVFEEVLGERVEPYNTRAYANALLKLIRKGLNGGLEREKIKDKARKQWDAKDIAQRYGDIYRKTLHIA